MKADAAQQHSLMELAELDAELIRIAHRAANLVELQRCDELVAQERAATDRAAVVAIAIEDFDGQVSRLESEIDAVRQREDRDRTLMASADTGAKQLAELQHELETLERRQASLEDSLLEVMERREELVGEPTGEQNAIAGMADELTAARAALDAAQAEIEATRTGLGSRREQLVALVGPDLAALYERAGAGALQGSRCGACRIEIDRGERARIAAADDDDVLRCPECGAILLRVKR